MVRSLARSHRELSTAATISPSRCHRRGRFPAGVASRAQRRPRVHAAAGGGPALSPLCVPWWGQRLVPTTPRRLRVAASARRPLPPQRNSARRPGRTLAPTGRRGPGAGAGRGRRPGPALRALRETADRFGRSGPAGLGPRAALRAPAQLTPPRAAPRPAPARPTERAAGRGATQRGRCPGRVGRAAGTEGGEGSRGARPGRMVCTRRPWAPGGVVVGARRRAGPRVRLRRGRSAAAAAAASPAPPRNARGPGGTPAGPAARPAELASAAARKDAAAAVSRGPRPTPPSCSVIGPLRRDRGLRLRRVGQRASPALR